MLLRRPVPHEHGSQPECHARIDSIPFVWIALFGANVTYDDDGGGQDDEEDDDADDDGNV